MKGKKGHKTRRTFREHHHKAESTMRMPTFRSRSLNIRIFHDLLPGFDISGTDANMKIEINLFATLAPLLPKESLAEGRYLEIEDGTTVSNLIDDLKIPVEQVKLIFVNGIHADMERKLENGDRLGIFPPIGGG